MSTIVCSSSWLWSPLGYVNLPTDAVDAVDTEHLRCGVDVPLGVYVRSRSQHCGSHHLHDVASLPDEPVQARGAGPRLRLDSRSPIERTTAFTS